MPYYTFTFFETQHSTAEPHSATSITDTSNPSVALDGIYIAPLDRFHVLKIATDRDVVAGESYGEGVQLFLFVPHASKRRVVLRN